MNTKFSEYDVVKSSRSLTEDVPSGTLGAVLMVFASIHPQYEVEFVNNAGESLALLTVKEDDLEFVQLADRGNRNSLGSSDRPWQLSRVQNIGGRPKRSTL
jgi:hypothetical protein